MVTGLKTLMVFVDGLGMGEKNSEFNPLYSGVCPTLVRLVEGAKPIDAGLGVSGLPQSATGQASLLTGENAAQLMGRHMEGYPNHALRAFVRTHNVFDQFKVRGYSSTFANAYYLEGYSERERKRRRSVTTVAAFQAFGAFRDTKEMEAGRAVYQDLTRHMLRERGYQGPLVEPEEAGAHLLAVAEDHDFTLFEYFQTDQVAHRGDWAKVQEVLQKLDAFLEVAVRHAEKENHLFLLTSDHGNIEEFRSKSHTQNPVPFVVQGRESEEIEHSVESLVDVVPALLRCYPNEKSIRGG